MKDEDGGTASEASLQRAAHDRGDGGTVGKCSPGCQSWKACFRTKQQLRRVWKGKQGTCGGKRSHTDTQERRYLNTPLMCLSAGAFT